ncbi:MAG: hypothetical protein FH751_12195 [Firmicutes bacterium]|nr:hypothetical protein [Bacillota bacterium]
MLVNSNIALTIKCKECGDISTETVSLFRLKRNDNHIFRCLCGKSKLEIKYEDYDSYLIKIDCTACKETHVFKYNLNQLLKGNIVNRCLDGMEILFISNDKDASKLFGRDKYKLDNILDELNFYDYFINFNVMGEVFDRVRNLLDEGSIVCDCGRHNIEMRLFTDRIELQCKSCSSVKMIYAENKKDLNIIKKKEFILLHKHSFECLDAIKFNPE